MAQDVTEKTKYQEDLKKTVERLSETNEELYSSNEELEESYSIIENQSAQMRKMIELFNRFDQTDMSLGNFYNEMLSLIMDIMTEADYGSISIIDKDQWKFIATSGHNLEKLKELNLHKKDAIIVSKPTIIKDIKNEKQPEKQYIPKTRVVRSIDRNRYYNGMHNNYHYFGPRLSYNSLRAGDNITTAFNEEKKNRK